MRVVVVVVVVVCVLCVCFFYAPTLSKFAVRLWLGRAQATAAGG